MIVSTSPKKGGFFFMFSAYHSKFHVKVDWAELDLFGHVNNVAFFKYIQASRVNYCESIGLSALNDEGKLSFMVASSQCQFKKPLSFREEITILTKVDWMKNSSLQLSYLMVSAANEVVAEAADVLVVYDHYKKTKVTISPELRSRIEAVEKNVF